MNVASELRRVYNEVEKIQISDGGMTKENYSRAVYLRGILHGFKLFYAVYNGDVVQEKLDVMINEIISKSVN